MKLSERMRQTAKSKSTSASIWDNWEAGGWDGLADEVAQLEDHLEEVEGYLSYERHCVGKLKAENEALKVSIRRLMELEPILTGGDDGI